jgi:hypothetical protein
MLRRKIVKKPQDVAAKEIREMTPEYGHDVTFMLVDLETSPSILDEIMPMDQGETQGVLVLMNARVAPSIKKYAWVVTSNETFTFLKLKYTEQLTVDYSDRQMLLILDYLNTEYNYPTLGWLTDFVSTKHDDDKMTEILNG